MPFWKELLEVSSTWTYHTYSLLANFMQQFIMISEIYYHTIQIQS